MPKCDMGLRIAFVQCDSLPQGGDDLGTPVRIIIRSRAGKSTGIEVLGPIVVGSNSTCLAECGGGVGRAAALHLGNSQCEKRQVPARVGLCGLSKAHFGLVAVTVKRMNYSVLKQQFR